MFGEVLGSKFRNLGHGMQNFAQKLKEIAHKSIKTIAARFGAPRRSCRGCWLNWRCSAGQQEKKTLGFCAIKALFCLQILVFFWMYSIQKLIN